MCKSPNNAGFCEVIQIYNQMCSLVGSSLIIQYDECSDERGTKSPDETTTESGNIVTGLVSVLSTTESPTSSGNETDKTSDKPSVTDEPEASTITPDIKVTATVTSDNDIGASDQPTDKPKTDEPKTDESKTDEPKTDEATDEPSDETDEPTNELTEKPSDEPTDEPKVTSKEPSNITSEEPTKRVTVPVTQPAPTSSPLDNQCLTNSTHRVLSYNKCSQILYGPNANHLCNMVSFYLNSIF